MVKRKTGSYSDVKFPGETYLASLFGVDRRTFHRYIKPLIIADHADIIQKMNAQNPDIGLDQEHNIYLKSMTDGMIQPTNCKISDYKEDEL